MAPKTPGELPGELSATTTPVAAKRVRREPPIDVNIRRLVRTLNRFPGTTTIGSCGGHEDPVNGQWPKGSWYVNVLFDRGDDGHFSLEFLAWAINNDCRRGGLQVRLYPFAPPPYLNDPGAVLRYHLEGDEVDPEWLATFLARVRRRLYVSAAEAAAALAEEGEPADEATDTGDANSAS